MAIRPSKPISAYPAATAIAIGDYLLGNTAAGVTQTFTFSIIIDAVVALKSGIANGIATLDGTGHLPVNQLPSTSASVQIGPEDYVYRSNAGARSAWFTEDSLNGGFAYIRQDDPAGGHPGICGIATGTTNNNTGWAATRTFDQAVHLGLGAVTWGSVLNVTALSTSGVPFLLRAGLIDSQAVAEGCYFEYTHSVNSGALVAKCSHSGSTTSVNTTFTVTAGTYPRLEILVNAAGTSVGFYVNGTLKATITTNIPTLTGFGVAILKTGTATASSSEVWVDYQAATVVLNTPR